MQIKDSIALITGGASGLGESCVRSLSALGAKVAILDIAAERGEKLAAELGANVILVHADVTSDENSRAAVEKAVAAFGTIHVAINCAGVADPGKILSKKGPMSLAFFNRVVQINLVGTLNIIRLAVEQMVKNTPNGEGEKGVIINTASVAAFDGQIGQASYSASKGGVVGMTLPIARDLSAAGIRVNCIAPGLIDTPIYGQGDASEAFKEKLKRDVLFPDRLGTATEFASMALELLSNSYMNAETIRVDGGVRMQPK